MQFMTPQAVVKSMTPRITRVTSDSEPIKLYPCSGNGLLVAILSFNKREVEERGHAIIDGKEIQAEIVDNSGSEAYNADDTDDDDNSSNSNDDDNNDDRDSNSGHRSETSMPQIPRYSALSIQSSRQGAKGKKPTGLMGRFKAGKDAGPSSEQPDPIVTSSSSESANPEQSSHRGARHPVAHGGLEPFRRGQGSAASPTPMHRPGAAIHSSRGDVSRHPAAPGHTQMAALPHRPATVQGKGKAPERRPDGGKTAEKEGAENGNQSRSHPKRGDPGKDKKPRGGSLFGLKKR